MQMELERHYGKYFLFVGIGNIQAVPLPLSVSPLLAGELDSPELSSVLAKRSDWLTGIVWL